MEHPFSQNSGKIMEEEVEKTFSSFNNETVETRELKKKRRKPPVPLFLIFACAVAAFLLFHPHPYLSLSRALEIAKTSKGLSPEMTNEAFIASYEDAARALEIVGWRVERIRGGDFLVSYLYRDGKGKLKGWFFEFLGQSGVARRLTRSMGDFYADLIDNLFERNASVVSEKELVPWRKDTFTLFGRRTVWEEIAFELQEAETEKGYGWIVPPSGGGKWIAGFGYRPESEREELKKRWIFHVDTIGTPPYSGEGAVFSFGMSAAEDLLQLTGEFGRSRLFSTPALADNDSPMEENSAGTSEELFPPEEAGPLEFFLKHIFLRYGNTAIEAMERLGVPQSVRKKKMTSIHDPAYKYVIATMTWPGLTLVFFQAPDKEMLISAIIKGEDQIFGPEPGIHVGESFSTVQAMLGEPDRREGNSVVYTDDAGFYDLVFMLKKNDVISEMKMIVSMD